MTSVRVRFAPSPTGYLHVGGGSTALCNWMFARSRAASTCLRIEDTDTERNRSELTDNILEMLEWLGLGWDGEPVRQSDRSELYADAAAKLVSSRTRVLLRMHRRAGAGAQQGRGRPSGYDGFCRGRGLGPGTGRALRFHAPDEGATTFADLIRGDISVDNRTIEDFVLLRSNGTPTFCSPTSSTTPTCRSPMCCAARSTSTARRSTSC